MMGDKTAISILLYHQQGLPHPSCLPIQARSSQELVGSSQICPHRNAWQHSKIENKVQTVI